MGWNIMTESEHSLKGGGNEKRLGGEVGVGVLKHLRTLIKIGFEKPTPIDNLKWAAPFLGVYLGLNKMHKSSTSRSFIILSFLIMEAM